MAETGPPHQGGSAARRPSMALPSVTTLWAPSAANFTPDRFKVRQPPRPASRGARGRTSEATGLGGPAAAGTAVSPSSVTCATNAWITFSRSASGRRGTSSRMQATTTAESPDRRRWTTNCSDNQRKNSSVGAGFACIVRHNLRIVRSDSGSGGSPAEGSSVARAATKPSVWAAQPGIGPCTSQNSVTSCKILAQSEKLSASLWLARPPRAFISVRTPRLICKRASTTSRSRGGVNGGGSRLLRSRSSNEANIGARPRAGNGCAGSAGLADVPAWRRAQAACSASK
mmetsp:Transcript_16211/g.44414  ORF Transcript_16211/g.44414 Transcript_16211/m.44414 type:complete len:286 (+) Transcript_16211:140-997(+)